MKNFMLLTRVPNAFFYTANYSGSASRRYGPQAGGFIRKEFSRAIEKVLRSYDLCELYGREKFIVITNDTRENTTASSSACWTESARRRH